MATVDQLEYAVGALRTGAREYSNAASSLRTQAIHLSASSQSLVDGADSWKGHGSDVFQSAWNQFKSDTQRLADNLDSMSGIFSTLSTAIDDAVQVKRTFDRYEPLAALAELGSHLLNTLLPVLHVNPVAVENEARMYVDEITQNLLNEAVMAADFTAAAALANIILEDISHSLESPTFDHARDIIGTIGTLSGTAMTIADQIAKDPAFKDVAHFIDKWKLDGAMTILGIGLDFLSGGQYDAKTLSSDIYGGGISMLIGLSPWGRAALIISGVINLGGNGLNWLQSQYANQFSGQMHTLLNDPAGNLQITAGNANIGKVFDDAGRIIIDADGGFPPLMFADSVCNLFGIHWHNQDETNTNLKNTAIDTGKLLLSVPQFIVNVDVMELDDKWAFTNSIIQNLPLPSPVKSFANTVTTDGIGAMNDVADFVTKPQGIEHVWNTVTSWF